jgi:hypothetical protein
MEGKGVQIFCSMTRTKRRTNTCRILLGNLLENGHRLCKYNIKVGLIEFGDEESRRIELAEVGLEWQALNLAVLDILCFMP